jgi:hypothetical protein
VDALFEGHDITVRLLTSYTIVGRVGQSAALPACYRACGRLRWPSVTFCSAAASRTGACRGQVRRMSRGLR